jgi:hypothetical protein
MYIPRIVLCLGSAVAIHTTKQIPQTKTPVCEKGIIHSLLKIEPKALMIIFFHVKRKEEVAN